MSNLILKVGMYRPRGYTIFPQTLGIYEDLIIFRKRRWFQVEEMTVTFNHIAQSNLKSGIFFSTIEIVTSGGGDNPSLKYILNKPAKKAQKIIEQKIYRVHAAKEGKEEFRAEPKTPINQMEKSLSRLRELNLRGKITDKEFEKRRKELVKEL